MKIALSTILALLVVVSFAPAALAADDGNTQPRVGTVGLYYPNDAYDAVNTTGTGNLKGIRCYTVNNALSVQITVNGGATQTISNLYDFGSDTLWIPMNVRFTTSLRVRFVNGTGYQNGGATCAASYAFD